MRYSIGVSTAHPLATEVGYSILNKGGNAVDASAAISFALGVVEPYASGIGGGGNMFIFPVNGSKPVIYDYRETAPTKLNKTYNIGVPGFVKGMERVVKDYGQLTLEKVMEPAIKLAENGFNINSVIANNIKNTKHKNVKQLEHYWPNNVPLSNGEKLIQNYLGDLMGNIAKNGSQYFYEQTFAQKLANMNVGITMDDLVNYDVEIRTPLRGQYHSYDVWSSPAPVSGSVIILALTLIEQLEIDKHDTNSPEYIAKFTELLQTIVENRIKYAGDPKHALINETELLSNENIQNMIKTIKSNNKHPFLHLQDDTHTTHFSVIDSEGMVVSTTNTLSNFFGSGVYINGVFLNNQMQNFSENENSPNSVAPGKRCVSIIAPTILSKNEKPVLAIGASGAARIPTIITRVIVDHVYHGIKLEEAVARNRFFTKNKDVYCEEELPLHKINKLRDLGLNYSYFPEPMFYGGVQAIVKEGDKILGAADPRRGGSFQTNKQ